jgi:hypothetical protein
VTIIETSVWIDFLNAYQTDHTLWMRRDPGRFNVGLTDLILTETLQGFGGDATYLSALKQLTAFPVFETAGRQLAIASAENYRWLRKRGITIRSTIDCITATFCIREGHSLLHNDRDFEPFEKHLGLKVIHP